MWPDLARAEERLAAGDLTACLRSLERFGLALEAIRRGCVDPSRPQTYPPDGAAFAELEARLRVLMESLQGARARALAELEVLRRTRGYQSSDPAPHRWIEDRA